MPALTHAKQFLTTVTAMAGVKADEPTMTISTAALDRDGDTLRPEGADLTAYRRNPVLLWGHDLRSLPIGTVTGLDVVPGQGLRAKWRWLENDEFAGRVRNAFEQGVVRGASVGFLPRRSQPNDTGTDFTQWELLEISLVPVPSNPQAVRTLKGLGLIPDDEDYLLIEGLGRVGAREFREVLGQAVKEATGSAMRTAMQRLTGRVDLYDDGEPILRVRDDGDETVHVDPDRVREAIREFASTQIRRALRQMRGDVD